MRGARPSEGSSIASSFASNISARAVASICCSPPESVPAICSLRSDSRGNSAKQCSSRLWVSLLVLRQEGAGEQVLQHRQLAERPPPLGAVHQAAHADLVRRQRVDALAGEAHLALEHDVAGGAALHALLEAHQPRDRAQQRRLAGAVRADQADELARARRASDTPFRICALS